MATKKEIVIVGGGYAGMSAIKFFEAKQNKYKVTLIDPKDFFYHTFGGIRNVAVDGWVDSVCVPYNIKGKENKHIKGKATKIDLKGNKVTVAGSNGEVEVPFDYAVLCTGQTNHFPANIGAVIDKSPKELLKKTYAEVKTAKKVVFIGGGPTGVEMAAEVKAAYPDKEVTLLHTG